MSMEKYWRGTPVPARARRRVRDRQTAILARSHESERHELVRKRETIALSRIRVVRDLEVAQNPRYRVLLQKALCDLDAQLSKLTGAC
jgi:hypothetical protein